MFSIKFIFLFTKLLELVVFCIYGKRMSKAKSNKTYWQLATIPIIAYTLIEGLRFGRKIDWNLYFFRYRNLGINTELEDYEPVFEGICNFLYNIGFSYPMFICFQCLLVIFSVVLFLSNHKELLKWALPISLILIAGNEMFIRFYMGFAFGLIGLYFTDRNDLNFYIKYILALLFAVIGGLNHLAAYSFILIIICKTILNKRVIPWQYSIPILFITTFLMSIADLMFITKFTDFLYVFGGNDYHGAGYLDRTDDILSGDFGHVGYMSSSFQTKIRTFIRCAPIFYYGNKYLVTEKSHCFYYNLFVIGYIIAPLFNTVEIFNRFSGMLCFMGCIIFSIVYMSPKPQKHKTIEYYLICISIIFFFYPFIVDALFRVGDENMMFIWDANGRNYLKWW